jgi:hypothetical protein
MAKLEELYLHDNQIRDAGFTSLADACAMGAMAQLEDLDLGGKQVKSNQTPDTPGAQWTKYELEAASQQSRS